MLRIFLSRRAVMTADQGPFEAAMFQVFTKLSRIACAPDGKLKRDNFVDAATYLAIAYEVGVQSGMAYEE